MGISRFKNDPVAVVGIACRFPEADHYSKFWQNLRDGRNSIREIPSSRWGKEIYSPDFKAPDRSTSKWCGLLDGVDRFDASFFGISARESRSMDPQQRLLLQETLHCIEDSGIPLPALQRTKTGVYIGVMAVDYLIESTADGTATDRYACLGNFQCILANRLSYFFGLTGPSFSIDAACGSSLVALHQARLSLLSGESDYAIAGGVSLDLNPWKYVSFSKARMLSPEGQCKTFDLGADGYVPGEGVGVVLLQRLGDALRGNNHVYGVIRGSGVRHTGHSPSITSPSIHSQQNLIAEVLKDSGVNPETVTYVEAHGTGTSLGDPIEVAALSRAFEQFTSNKQFCSLGSIKSNIGHLEAAAGIASLIKVLLMMRHRQIPPTLNVAHANPLLFLGDSPFKLALDCEEWKPSKGQESLRAAISSFGFGGTISHLILESFPEAESQPSSSGGYPFLLSAKTEDSLQRLRAKWLEFSAQEQFRKIALRDYCGTLATGRLHHKYRWSCRIDSHEDLITKLRTPSIGITSSGAAWWLHAGDCTWSGFGETRPFFRHASLVRCRWQALKRDIENSSRFGRKSLNLRGYWAEPERSANTFLVNHLYLSGLMALGFAPALVAGTGSGIWQSLVISGLVSSVEAFAFLDGNLLPEDIRLSPPTIGFHDPLTGQIIGPVRFDTAYFLELFANLEPSAQDWRRFLEDARALEKAQYTFKSYLREWTPALEAKGLSVERLLAREVFSRAEEVLRILVIQTALLKLYRKWDLFPRESIGDPRLRELAHLIARADLDKGVIADLAFGDSSRLSGFVESLNRGIKERLPREDFPLLHSQNRLPSSLMDFPSWLETVQRQPAAIPLPEGLSRFEFGNQKGAVSSPATVRISQPVSILDTVLALWQAGAEIAWESYFLSKPFYRRPLPVYEFGGETYWVDKQESAGVARTNVHSDRQAEDTAAAANLAEPTGRLVRDSGNPGRFVRRLSPVDDGIIRDTVVEGRCITPSPLRLALALEAGKRTLSPAVNRLSEIYFPNPGVIGQAASLVVELGEAGEFRLTRCIGGESGGELLARGKVEQAVPAIPPHFERDGEAVENTIGADVLYALFAMWGYRYGPGMRLIRKIEETRNAFLIHIEAKPTDEAAPTGLDPFILDCMFQGVFYAGHVLGDLLRNLYLYVPIGIKRLTLLDRITEDCCAVIEKARCHITGEGDIRLGFNAYDLGGNPILVAEDLYFRRVPRTFLTAPAEAAEPDTSESPRYDTRGLLPKTKRYLQEVFAAALGQSSGDLDENAKFQGIGVDSLINQEIVERLIKVFPDLPITVLFEYTTLKELAAYFVESHERKLCEILAMPRLETSRGTVPAMVPPPVSRSIAGTESAAAGCAARLDGAVTEGAEPIAIIGCAGRFPQSPSLEAFWENLKQGRDCIREVPAERWNYRDYYDPDRRKGKSYTQWGGFLEGHDEFDPLFFNLTPKQAQLMDPQQRIFLETAWSSVEDAGYTRRSLPRNTGVFVGVTTNTYGLWAAQGSRPDSPQCPDTDSYDIANRVSYFCDFHGPSMSVDTACSSSLSCVHLAVQSLRQGECEMAVAGGVSLTLHPSRIIQFCQKNMLSTESYCHPFGEGPGGFVDAEGAAAIVLKPLSRAIRDRDSISAVILGSAINSGGRTSGYTVPSPAAQARLVAKAIARAGISPRTISYVETHGTGTLLGDPIEIEGLTQAFRQHTDASQFCAIGSVKSNIGHLIAAAGISGLIKVLLQMKHRTLVPSLHAEPLNPRIPFAGTPFYVQRELAEWKAETPRRAGVSSFGVGGSNAHVILEEYVPPAEVRPPAQGPWLIPLSARNPDRLLAYVRKFLDFLPSRLERLNLQDIGYTLQVGREPLEERLALVVSGALELVPALERVLAGGEPEGVPCFRGNARAGRESAVLSLDDEAGAAYLKVLLERKDLARLAGHWVQGAEVDWEALYADAGSAAPRRISLPGYPYARQRFWLPEEDPPADGAGRPVDAGLHPLLDRVDAVPAPAQGITFRKTLAVEHWLFQDHRVNGAAVLPGVASLELAWAAAAEFHLGPVKIGEMVWREPLAPSRPQVEIRVRITKEGEGLAFEMQGGAEGEPSGKHAYGRLSSLDSAPPPPLPWREIEARCPETVEGPALYNRFRGAGIGYGPAFRCITRLRKNGREALGFLRLPESSSRDFARYRQHPALLDAALQTALALWADEPAPRLPFMVEEVAAYRSPAPTMIAYAKRIDAQRAEVYLLDETGKQCVRFGNAVFRESRDPLADFFFTPRWVPEPPGALPEEGGTGETILAFLPPPEDSEAALKVLAALRERHAGSPVIPLRETGFDAAAFPEIHRIYFLAGLIGRGPEPGETGALETIQDFSVHALHRVVRSLVRGGHGDSPLRLTVLTAGIHAVGPEAEVFPWVAGLSGLAKTLIREYPHWRINRLALNPAEVLRGEAELPALLAEPRHTGAEEVAWHRGQRQVRRMVPAPLPPVSRTPLRQRGVYLIAGGLGGVGRQLAEYLAETVQARLILLGRKPLDARRGAEIAEIEKKGAEVLYLPTDLVSPTRTREAVAHGLARFGEIHGVFGSALILRDQALENMTAEDFRAVYDTKAQGSVNLCEALESLSLDFILFFSSVLAVVGNPGQGNYVAGGTFQDAYARYLDRHRPYPVQVVNWGYWGTVGIVASEDYRRRMGKEGLESIQPEEGMEAIRRILAHREAQVVAAKAGRELRERMFVSPPGESPDTAGGLPATLEKLAAVLNPSALVQPDLFRYQEGYRALQGHAHGRLLACFRDLGLAEDGKSGAIPARYARFHRAALRLLERAGPIGALSPAEAEGQRALLARSYPEVRAHLDLLVHCIDHYPALFREEILPTQVMFPGSSMEKVEGVYRNNPVSDYFNALAAQSTLAFIAERAKTLAEGEKIRLLEIGAGTGGTSASVLKAVRAYGDRLEYVYTDVSNFFLVHGRKQFAETCPFLAFRLLDIAGDPAGQGFQPESFDLILATNVLHATPRIAATLDHVRSLLKVHGWVVLNEMTAAQDVLTLTFGLLDGWWLYEDEDRRIPDSPLLTPETWRQLFRQAGFRRFEALGTAPETGLDLAQTVMLAEKSAQAVAAPVPKDRPAAAPELAASLEPAGATGGPVPPTPIPRVAAAFAGSEDLEQRLLEIVIEGVEAASGIEGREIDEDRPFSEYGIDSITGIELINGLNRSLGIALSKTALFDHTTVAALVGHIAREYGADLVFGEIPESGGAMAGADDPGRTALQARAAPTLGADREQRMLEAVLNAAEKASGIAVRDIDEDRPFSEYGIDSITGIELVNELNQTLGIALSKTALFDHATVAALAGHIAAEYGQDLTPPAGTVRDSALAPPPFPAAGPSPAAIDPDCLHYGFRAEGDWSRGEEAMLHYRITVEDNNCIRDHVIYGQYIMPSDAYLEILYIGARRLLGYGAGLEVESFDIKFPMITFPGVPLEGRLRLTPGAKGNRYAVESRKAGETGAYQVSVDGGFREIAAAATVNREFRKIWEDYEIEVAPSEIYTPDAILKVGPSYRTIQQIRIRGNTAVSRLRRSPEGERLRGRFVLEPSIVDGLFATGLQFATHLSGNRKNFFIPVLFDRIRVFGELRGDRYFGLVKAHSVKPDHITLNLALIDDEDREILVFQGFHLQRILADDLKKYARGSEDGADAKATPAAGVAASGDGAADPGGNGRPMNIAIIGMAGRFPLAAGVEEYWENLARGRNCVTEVPGDRWDLGEHYHPDPASRDKTYSKWGGFLENIDRFDSLFFQISGKEAELTDPQQRVFLEDCWRTLEDAGYSDAALSGLKVGVFAGATKGDYQTRMHHEEGAAIEGFSFPGNEPSVLAARISYFLNLKGPSIAVNTACSSSLVAINLACQSLLAGETDMALAGGIHIATTPLFYKLTSKSGMLSPTGQCRAFDNDANGFVPGEASAAILLKPLDKALRDGDPIYGVIRGIGVNQDGKTNGMTAPSAASQAELERSVYKRYGIPADSINYVETHGTGTKLGDPIEIEALTQAFRKFTQEKQFCPIGSAKTNIGHAAYAAGVSSVIKVLLAMKHRKIPPSLHCDRPNEYIDFENSPFYVNRELRDWTVSGGRPRRAAISSFGISGTNCHLVIDEAPALARTEPRPARPAHLIPVSAKTPGAYAQRCADLLRWLEEDGKEAALGDIAWTLQAGRSHFACRAAFLVQGKQELADRLRSVPEPRRGTASRELRQQGQELLRQIREAGAEAAETALLERLGSLYEQGYTPDWTLLNPEGEGRRLSLPTYPFERERYWIPDTAPDRPVPAAGSGVLHPLLDRVHPGLSLAQGLTYEKTFESSDWLLQHHRVEGAGVLPGAAILEMARAALALSLDRPFRLARIVWTKPLRVEGRTPVRFDLREAQGRYHFALRSEAGDLHAGGEGVPADPPAEPTPMNGALALRSQGLPELEGQALYAQLRNFGIHHGPAFQCLRRIYLGRNEALAELAPDPQWERQCRPCALPPALLDGCLQLGAAHILNGTEGGGRIAGLLPVSVESAEFFAPPDPKGYVHLEKLGPLRYTLTLLDAEGRISLRLRDACYQARRDPLADFFYMPRWEARALPTGMPRPAGTVLFVSVDRPAAENLKAALMQTHAGDSLWEIRLGTHTERPGERRRQVDPADPRGIAECFDAGGFPRPDLIYFMGGIQDPPQDFLPAERLRDSQQRGVLSLLRLIQALAERHWIHDGIRLRILTEGAQAVLPEERVNPLAGGLFGLAKTAAKEYPALGVSCVDFRKTDAMADLAARIRAEPDAGRGREVALRRGERYVLTLEPIDLPPAEQTVFRQRGVYLILGGAGGIGYAFSCHLAEQVQARLVWIGRSAPDAGLREKLDAIAARGGEALYLQADASDPEALKQAVAQARERYGRIHGAVHSALVLRDRSLAKMDERTFLEALAPKVQGSVNLHAALDGEPLDFFLFFSSGESFTCYAGQSNYAAACTFKDAYARHLQAISPYPVKTLNWGYWGTVGVVSGETYRRQLAARGVYSIDPEEGMEAIERALASSRSQVVPMKVSREHLREIGVELYGEAAVPAPAAETPAMAETPAAAPPDTGWDEKVEDFVRTVLAEALKLKKSSIDPEAPFAVYGMDSLVVTGVLQAFERHLGKLPVVTLYRHDSAGSLARYFAEHHRERLETLLGTGTRDGSEAAPVAPPAAAESKAEVSHRPASPPNPGSPLPARADGEGAARAMAPVEGKGGRPDSATSTAPVAQEPPQPAPTPAVRRSGAERADRDIAVIGLSGRYPMAGDLERFWQNLEQGRNCIREIPRERWDWEAYYAGKHAAGAIYSKWGGFIDEADKFDPLFFAIPPNEARLMDPQERVFIECAWSALEDAGYTRVALRQRNVGVFVGVMHADYEVLAGELWLSDPTIAAHSSSWSVANRISYLLDLAGPSLAVNTACSSALTAIHLACESIQRGECELAIAGGVNLILHPKHYLRLAAATMLTPGERCRSFGADADGFVAGEGVGAVLLKPLARAEADGDPIHGVIKASAMNAGGRTGGYTVPNPDAQTRVIADALRRSGIDPDTVNYVEAHGTGTALGDPIEIAALTSAYRELGVRGRGQCALGSVKSNIGHLESAAGIAGLTKVLLQMKHRVLAPTLHAERPNPYIDFEDSPFYLQQAPAAWEPVTLNGIRHPRRAGLSSFGAGGTNHHMVLEEYPAAAADHSRPGEAASGPWVFPLSAQDPERLLAYAERYLDFLRAGAVDPESLGYTLQQGREAMAERLAIVFRSQSELAATLDRWLLAQKGEPDARVPAADVFRGRAQAETPAAGGFRSLPAGDRPAALAEAWAAGRRVDWLALYAGRAADAGPPRRISLPTYPFRRERCWIPSAPEPTAGAAMSQPVVAVAPAGFGGAARRGGGRSVAVIGAGPGGLAAAKCLLEDGHAPTVFEKTDRIGGIWCFREDHRGGPYLSTRLQTSKFTSLYSDFPPPEAMSIFPGVAELNRYFNDYAGHFGLWPHIRLNTALESLAPEGERWRLGLRGPEGGRHTLDFDAVCICTGGFWQPRKVSCPGLEGFRGETLHSADYHSPEIFRGKRVLVIGNGVSGMDIAVDATGEARRVVVSLRSKKMIIPRMFGFTPNDCAITAVKRLIIDRQSVPEILGEWRGSIPEYLAALEEGGLLPAFPVKENVLLVSRDFPQAVNDGRIGLRPEVRAFTAGGCEFRDGSREAFDIVVDCTGYEEPEYPFLPPSIQVGELYKHQFHPEHPGLCFIGRKQASLSVIPTLELEARWFSGVLSGTSKLPGADAMRQAMAEDRRKESRRGSLFPAIDSSRQNMWLAEQIGAFPHPVKDWKLYWKLVNLPAIPAVYRLVGPNPWPEAENHLEALQRKLYVNRNDPRIEKMKYRLLARLGAENLETMAALGQITPAERAGALEALKSLDRPRLENPRGEPA